ncbi:MAG TPA: FUSC family protein [Mycobacteriales bacterium]
MANLLTTARTWLRAEWAPAARATVAMVVPLGAAVAAGDLHAGLTMSLGAFAALYGRQEPYRRRAVLVGGVAVGLVAATVLGSVAAGSAWTAALAIAVVGAVSTWAAQSTALGPPGAYMLTLVAAVSTYLPLPAGGLWTRAGYVALGAAFAWCVVMSGALVRPAVPQTRALAAAYDAVAALLRAPSPLARHAAAAALRVAGDHLVAAGPHSGDAGRLRALHGYARRAFLGGGDPAEFAAVAAALRSGRPTAVDPAACPDEHLMLSSRWHLGPHSLAVPAGVRVFVAALLAAGVAAAVGLPHTYWAPAAAVVVLQATSARLTMTRAVHRIAGTVVGVLIAAGVFALHPSPVLVVVIVGLLQFVVEVCIGRMYALGVSFVTPLALLIAESGGIRTPLHALLGDRLTETVIGCAVGILVAMTVLPRAATRRVPRAIEFVRQRQAMLESLLSGGGAEGQVAGARRDVVDALTSLAEAIRNAKGELRPDAKMLVAAGEAADAGWLAVTRVDGADVHAPGGPTPPA